MPGDATSMPARFSGAPSFSCYFVRFSAQAKCANALRLGVHEMAVSFSHQAYDYILTFACSPRGGLFCLRPLCGTRVRPRCVAPHAGQGPPRRCGLHRHAHVEDFHDTVSQHCWHGAHFRRHHGRQVWRVGLPVDCAWLPLCRCRARLPLCHDFVAARRRWCARTGGHLLRAPHPCPAAGVLGVPARHGGRGLCV